MNNQRSVESGVFKIMRRIQIFIGEIDHSLRAAHPDGYFRSHAEVNRVISVEIQPIPRSIYAAIDEHV